MSQEYQDLFAVSCLVQWVLRSRLRDGQPIFLYILAGRMARLFERWLDGEMWKSNSFWVPAAGGIVMLHDEVLRVHRLNTLQLPDFFESPLERETNQSEKENTYTVEKFRVRPGGWEKRKSSRRATCQEEIIWKGRCCQLLIFRKKQGLKNPQNSWFWVLVHDEMLQQDHEWFELLKECRKIHLKAITIEKE